MRAVVLYKADDVRVVARQDPKILKPTDAIVRLTATCICGSDLWPYHGIEPAASEQAMREDTMKPIRSPDFAMGDCCMDTSSISESGDAGGGR